MQSTIALNIDWKLRSDIDPLHALVNGVGMFSSTNTWLYRILTANYIFIELGTSFNFIHFLLYAKFQTKKLIEYEVSQFANSNKVTNISRNFKPMQFKNHEIKWNIFD